MQTLLIWLLRLTLLAFGVGAAVALVRWIRDTRREERERWAVRLGVGMLLLAGVYAAGHARLLVERGVIEEGRDAYVRFGDPRRAEINRAEVRGWILDCTGEPENALARYGVRDGEIERVYPLGEGGANLVGGGRGAETRDYTVERLFAEWLRSPRDWGERGQLHPVGTDLRLALCSDATRRAWNLLQQAERSGAVVVQNVETGAVVAYAATGEPEQAPVGIKRYAPPGSVFKLALAALWWESGLPDQPMECPPSIQVTPRARISNYEVRGKGTVEAPREMLVFSCNTTAVQMALEMRERLGSEAFVDAYRTYGFTPYMEQDPPEESVFWATDSEAWAQRMTPPPARIRIGEETGVAEWAQLAIGQGPVDVTPIQVSRFLQAIGNGGVMLPPTIEWERAGEPEEGRRIMQAATAQKLQAAMREVIDRGTARSAAPRLQGLAWDLGGKTGTAQVSGAPDDGWFAGLIFGPSGKPLYSVTVYLRGGGPGGATPAAIAAEMTRFFANQAAEGEGPRASS